MDHLTNKMSDKTRQPEKIVGKIKFKLLDMHEFSRRISISYLFPLPIHLAEKESAQGKTIYFSSMKYADGSELQLYARLNE